MIGLEGSGDVGCWRWGRWSKGCLVVWRVEVRMLDELKEYLFFSVFFFLAFFILFIYLFIYLF